jgi:hypothetical protein
MKNLVKTLILSGTLLMVLAGCATMNGFEEGRALGKKNTELTLSASYAELANYLTYTEGSDDVPKRFKMPVVEANVKVGVSDRWDVGGKVNSSLNLALYYRHQMIGDKTSRFALGSGLEISAAFPTVFTVQIPVHMTYYFSEKLALNVAPRGVYLVGSEKIDGEESFFSTDAETTFLGGNVGLLYGKKVKYGIDLGLYRVRPNNLFFIAGAGVKMRF